MSLPPTSISLSVASFVLADEGEGAGGVGVSDSEEDDICLEEWMQRSNGGNNGTANGSGGVTQPSILKQSRPTPVPAMKPITKCGWIEKLGDVTKAWKVRWFVLRGSELAWHKDSDAAARGDIQGSINLIGADVTSDLTTGDIDPDGRLCARTFGIQPRSSLVGGRRVYALRVAQPKERETWLTAIERARTNDTNTSSSSSSSSSSNTNGSDKSNKSRWHHDELCYGCRSSFTLTRRRHHCRRCLHAHCQKCSSKQFHIPDEGFKKPVRVCDDCYSILTAPPRTKSDTAAPAPSSSTVAAAALPSYTASNTDPAFNAPTRPRSGSRAHRPRPPSPPQRVRHVQPNRLESSGDSYVAFDDAFDRMDDGRDDDQRRRYSDEFDEDGARRRKTGKSYFCCF